ncbi:hypothetical protein C6A87_003010 [Mycobacterium sp. ITM-2016-00317]|uniref:hypothetical protein n=1 Tax=Mycobacterium sp. ITM-2016-00317 TaxID=2099694 RepID=UPI00287F9CF8|nr:hypothetical protein [Mycobacterium sp. ITM-2016-00317]WNG88243.1 hypothetical protein C6A87_003010 [Mycobacterium sp. ITM-2016-00317]
MTVRLGVPIVAALALFATPLASSPTAWSQPDVTGVVLTADALGMSPTIGFNSANSPQTMSIPAPDGAQPGSLTGQIQSVSNITTGYLEFNREDGSLLTSVPIPDVRLGQATVPFTVDLSTVTVRDHFARVVIVLRQTDGDSICGTPPNVTLSRLSVNFDTQPGRPRTLDQFFPAVVSTVDILVDPAPDHFESQTVLNLVSMLNVRYRALALHFNVRPLPRQQEPPPAQWDPMRRTIVVRSGTEAQVKLVEGAGSPYLTISGEGSELVEQTALFRSELLALAQTPSTTVDSVEQFEVRGGGSASFEQLGVSGRLSVLGQASIYSTPDTAMFGLGNPGAIETHLIAHHTPVKADEKATVTVQSGGRVFYSAGLGETGLLDAKFTIPGDLGGSMAGWEILVSYEPAPGACNPRTVPLTFELDGSSTVAVTGGSVLMGGFSALPVGFSPTFQVALGESTPEFLSRAAAIIASVQRLTAQQLQPNLVDLPEAIGNRTSALIVADSAQLGQAALDSPIESGGEAEITAVFASKDQVTLDLPEGLGSIQAFADRGRTVVLVTTSGDWELVDRALDYIAGLQRGWRDLAGDVVVAGPDGEPKNLTIRARGPELQVIDTGTQWLPWALTGGAAVLVGSFALAALGIHRRRRGSRDAHAAD